MNPLIAQLTGVLQMTEGAIWQTALVFLRVGAAVALLPGLGEHFLPQRVKLAAVVVLTLIVAPAVSGQTLADYDSAARFGAAAILTEVMAGLFLGFVMRLLILGLQTAGTLIAQSVSLAQMFSGTGPEPQPIVSNLLVLAGIVLFCTLGGLARSVELMVLSYDLLPPGAVPDSAALSQWGLLRISRIFALAFTLAAPFVIAALLYNLALGAINRAMPGLMVTFIGAPALTLGGLILLALLAPFLLQSWQDAVLGSFADPFGPG